MRSLRRIAAVSSDPGSTNALMPVARALEEAGAAVWAATSGPAGYIWDSAGLRALPVRLEDRLPVAEAERLLREQSLDALVSGAGAFNELEHTFRLAARRMGLPSVAVLDDRGRYRERLGRPGPRGWVPSVPDRICVMDEETRREMLREGFPAEALSVTGQPHLEEVERFFGGLSEAEVRRRREAAHVAPGERVVAFFSEPLAEALGTGGRLTAQLSALSLLGRALLRIQRRPPGGLLLIVKPHPREDCEPLRHVVNAIRREDLRVHFVAGGNALELVAVADVVVGILSMVLFEARLAGRPVVSVQIGHPPAARWWGGTDPSIRVATTEADLKAMLDEALAERPAPPSRSRFRGATQSVLGVLGSVAAGVPAAAAPEG